MNEQEYYRERLSAELHDKKHTHQSEMSKLVETEEFNLLSILRPRIYIDGNKWCVLYGTNIQDGICGFGYTPKDAVYDFNKSWNKNLSIATLTGVE